MATGKMMGGGERILMTLKYGEARMRFSRAFYEAHMRSDLIKNDVNTKVVELFKKNTAHLKSGGVRNSNSNKISASVTPADCWGWGELQFTDGLYGLMGFPGSTHDVVLILLYSLAVGVGSFQALTLIAAGSNLEIQVEASRVSWWSLEPVEVVDEEGFITQVVFLSSKALLYLNFFCATVGQHGAATTQTKSESDKSRSSLRVLLSEIHERGWDEMQRPSASGCREVESMAREKEMVPLWSPWSPAVPPSPNPSQNGWCLQSACRLIIAATAIMMPPQLRWQREAATLRSCDGNPW
ncbi:hypothetical protein C8J57DRAFT_1254894 [Mycena rebaudengoi]|nr:hypothetical protein C8J57DRAFT_1254894 [Mycena rebaudengoi]